MIPNIIQIKKEPCNSHKRESVYKSYMEYHIKAEEKKAKGETQTQCKICGRWYFKDEL